MIHTESNNSEDTNTGQIQEKFEAYCWRKRKSENISSQFKGASFSLDDELLLPTEYFKRFFDDNLIVHIAEQTNLCNIQEKFNSSIQNTQYNLTGKTLNTDSNEIEQLIGILLLMGIYPNPQYRMYWNPSTTLPQITNALKGGLTRFETLKLYLHFYDNF